MEPIAIDCIVDEDGSVRVRRIKRGENWEAVEQGRQWQDDEGRHVLIMLQGTDVRGADVRGASVREAVLSPDDLRWRLKQTPGPRRQIV